MSLYTETGKFSPALTQSIHDWFMTTSFTSSYVSVTGYYDANENNKNKPLRFLGYNNSEVLDLYYDTFKTDFECFQYQDDCESNFRLRLLLQVGMCLPVGNLLLCRIKIIL